MRRAVLSTIVAFAAAAPAGAAAYPDWSGPWKLAGPTYKSTGWDPTKPPGSAQDPPLTPEYRAVWQASLADEKRGGVGGDYGYLCLPAGMPGMMASYFLVDFVVLPRATYVLFEEHMPRRIDTDGRPWPAAPEPSFAGTSIGRWLDSDGDGAYDTLEVETRGMKGPRSFADGSGIPLASDNQTVVKETISRPKDKPDVLIDVITTSDHALSRPWTVAHVYERYRGRPWTEQSCAETARIVKIGGEPYVIRDDGDLMPLKKGQKPPDLKYFDQAH